MTKERRLIQKINQILSVRGQRLHVNNRERYWWDLGNYYITSGKMVIYSHLNLENLLAELKEEQTDEPGTGH